MQRTLLSLILLAIFVAGVSVHDAVPAEEIRVWGW